MVRGPAAVLSGLGLLAAAQVYVVVAPDLPLIGHGDAAILVAMACGLAAIVACIAVVVPVSDTVPLIGLVAAGALGLVAVFNVAGAGASATPVEAVAYGAVGALFAVGLLAPSLALALPVFVAVVDAISTLAGGLSETLANAPHTHAGDPLSLELPLWGGNLPAGRLGISDAVFAGVFLLYVRRLGLRSEATAVGLWIAMVVAVALGLWLDHPIPVLPLMAVAYFAANADRLPAVLRAAGRE